MWIDSHCHLHYDYTGKTAEQLVAEAREHGVETLVTVGVDFTTMDAIESVSAKFPNVFHTVGIHPSDAIQWDTETNPLDRLRQASMHPKCRALGEMGLDYHYDHSPKEKQIPVLETQLDLAIERNLPVVIHSRDGEHDLLPRLESYAKRSKLDGPKGILHCFTGTHAFAQACIDFGFLVSISGIVTFKNAEELRSTVVALPADKLLVETDCPYLAPIPFRGKKCEPYMVKWTGEFVANLKGLEPAKFAEITSRNARAVFRI